MVLSGSQIETTSTGATWMSRHKSLFPYHPAPIKPTRLGFPFTTSSASAPQVGSAASAVAAVAVFKKSRRLIEKGWIGFEFVSSGFMGAVCRSRAEAINPNQRNSQWNEIGQIAGWT